MTDTDCTALDPECDRAGDRVRYGVLDGIGAGSGAGSADLADADGPPEIRRLECDLATAFHAFTAQDGMTDDHLRRMRADATGAVLDAASAAARAGHAHEAVLAVWRAGGRRPAWALRTPGWDDLLAACLDAVAAADETGSSAGDSAADQTQPPPPTIGA